MTPDEACQQILDSMRKGTSFAVAVRQDGVPLHVAQHWRRHGTATGLDFDAEVRAVEGDLIGRAEARLGELASAERPAQKSTRADRQDMNTQLSAVMWFLERRCSDYGRTPLVTQELQREVARELLAFLEGRVPPEAFERVQDALSGRTLALER